MKLGTPTTHPDQTIKQTEKKKWRNGKTYAFLAFFPVLPPASGCTAGRSRPACGTVSSLSSALFFST